MTDATPLDVAVQLDEIERYKFALLLAVKHGFSDNPDAFACRLRGDTTDQLTSDSVELLADIAALRRN
ncbi:hypothetical protein [Pseudonocardia hydrocarbonoxydans]|uniref:Uncharacterized protein n=1 Tax=Pseudonocardia hydrocarbonoxydans TaxID=76726 RepID=A0A4Y3WTP1_9PSEU|nr:hypothetical protein [Pseudonocardia hydrocarbonoxydans]GEC22213.1 hypothetical protein PHY01_44960 [Pseudonocardia hydrocarbonoxydans]